MTESIIILTMFGIVFLLGMVVGAIALSAYCLWATQQRYKRVTKAYYKLAKDLNSIPLGTDPDDKWKHGKKQSLTDEELKRMYDGDNSKET